MRTLVLCYTYEARGISARLMAKRISYGHHCVFMADGMVYTKCCTTFTRDQVVWG